MRRYFFAFRGERARCGREARDTRVGEGCGKISPVLLARVKLKGESILIVPLLELLPVARVSRYTTASSSPENARKIAPFLLANFTQAITIRLPFG